MTEEESRTRAPRPPAVPPPINDVLTVVESVYFHPVGRDPRVIDCRWHLLLRTSGEQPYERYLRAKPEWQPLDTGWVEEVGMLVIQNEEGDQSLTNPQDGASDVVIEVAFEGARDGDSFLIYPRESLRFRPRNKANLRVRCPGGTARYHVFVTPK